MQKTEVQARQQCNSDRDDLRGRHGRRPRRPFGKSPGKNDKRGDVAVVKKQKIETSAKKQPTTKEKPQKKATPKRTEAAAVAVKKGSPKTTGQKKTALKKPFKSDVGNDAPPVTPGRPSRSAARKAATQITKSAAEWMPPDDDSGSDVFKSGSESSSDEESEIEADKSSESNDSDSDDNALQRIRAKQQGPLDRARKSGGKKKQNEA